MSNCKKTVSCLPIIKESDLIQLELARHQTCLSANC